MPVFNTLSLKFPSPKFTNSEMLYLGSYFFLTLHWLVYNMIPLHFTRCILRDTELYLQEVQDYANE